MRILTSHPKPSGRPTQFARGLGVALAVLLLAATGSCTPLLDEGQFRCDPEAEAPCPPGFACQRRTGDGSFRCFQHPGDVCGDNVAGPSEPCDGGDLGGARCADFGFFTGELHCSQGCEISTDGCVQLESVVLSTEHGCGLDAQGGVWCWGSLVQSWAREPTPTRLSFTRPVVSLATGYEHVLALDDEGRAWCWGLAETCGVGITVWSLSEPTPVAGDHVFVQVSTSAHLGCGLKENGEAWCWGQLVEVQDEGAALEWVGVPQRVDTSTSFESLTVGALHACGLDAHGAAWCWGENDSGQLGVGTTDATFTPVPVQGDHELTELHAAHETTCGLDADSGLWCWGLDRGALSVPEDATRMVPVRQQAPFRFQSVTLGDGLICGVDDADAAWCWGGSEDTPEPLLSGSELRRIWTSYYMDSVCALDGLGDVWCQGWNGGSQLVEPVERSVPRPVVGTFDAIGAGRTFSCGLADGVAHCWGAAYLGDGTYRHHATPLPVALPTASGFKALDVGSANACALDVQGAIWCWGADGAGDYAYVPEQVSETGEFTAITSGNYYSCALDVAGQAWCWGSNSWSRAGSSSLEPLTEPTLVAGGHAFISISAKWRATCAVDDAGQAWCWGYNSYGACGRPIGEFDYTATPVPVQGGLTLASVVAFDVGACALDESGRAWCWGHGSSGQTGVGMQAWHDVPLPVVGEHEFVSLAAGTTHVCGLDTDQRAWCWGSNYMGNLGDGTTELRSEPTAVVGDHRFTSLTADERVTCGLDTDGQAWCWGENDLGQAGADDRFDEPVLLRDD